MVGLGGGVGGGSVTVIRALALTRPPGPLAVAVYVAEEPGLTSFLPEASTLPMPGSMETDVAFVDDH